MNIISTTTFRDNLGNYVDNLIVGKSKGFVIGRYEKPEAVVIPFPQKYNKNLSDATNLAMYGGSFDFLEDEPNAYSVKDTIEWKKKHKLVKR